MSRQHPFFRYRLHHLLAWILLGLAWYYLRYQDYSSTRKAVIITCIKVVDLAIMIYVTNYVLLPRLLYRKKYFLFGFSLLAMIVLSSFGKMQLIGSVLGNPSLFSLSGGNYKARIYDNVLPHIFLVIAGAAIKLMYDHMRMQQRINDIAREKAETELQFLRSQINPHFVFNSLNSVFFLIDKDNKDARKALHTFSEMLRYQLYEMNGTQIPVEKEISYLEDYVNLQRLRKDENFSIQFNCATGTGGFMIAPLLLIPFVENAFKHISYYQHRLNFVRICISRENARFDFTVINSTETNPSPQGQQGGIGLTNVKRRLELLYPGRHELKIEPGNNEFKVHLSIKIN